MNWLKLFLYSLIALSMTIAFGFLVGMVVPTQVVEENAANDVNAKRKAQTLTIEEADRARKAMEKQLAIQMAKEKEKSLVQHLTEAREAGKWISWLPWIALPILARLKRFDVAALILLMPAALTLTHFLLPLELIFIAIALFASIFWSRKFSQQADNPKSASRGNS